MANLKENQELNRNTNNFVFNLSLGANESYFVDVANRKQTDSLGNATQYYAPLKNIQVINQSNNRIGLRINEEKGYKLVPSGTIFEINNKTIWYFSVINLEGSSANDIILTADNYVSEKELLQLIAQRGAKL